MIFRDIEQQCPRCGEIVDSHGDVPMPGDDTPARGPEPGDYTLCLRCMEPLQFTKNMTLAVVEWRRLPLDVWVTLRRAKNAILVMRRQKSRMQ